MNISRSARACRGALALVLLALSTIRVPGQVPDGHSEHHPAAAAPAQNAPASPGSPPSPPAAPAPSAGPMRGGMDDMRGMMGIPPPKEFYPTLMGLPALTADQRRKMEEEARARINAGIEELSSAEGVLRHAVASRDAAAADEAVQRLREALGRVGAGTAALRALAEGKPPPRIAQDWFKTQLNLPSKDHEPASAGLLGLSWSHLVTMATVAAFSVFMAVVYFLRMRRVNALVGRLAGPGANPAGNAPPPAIEPRSPAPTDTGTSTARASPPIPPGSAASTPPRPGLWKGKLKVAAIFRETPNVKTFRLRDPEGGQIPFSFAPGQFVTYSAEIGGELVRRSYTIASSAAQTAHIETTVKREDAGIFSEYLHDKVAVGDLIDVIAPSGVFTFRGSEADSVVLIGGGVGITPLMAAIRYLTDIAWPGEIFLIYGARTTADFIFRDEIEYLQRHHTNLHVAATMARAAGTSWMGPEGPVTKELLAQVVPEIAKRRIHLCGPPGMMSAVRTCLADLGVPADQIKTEAFGPARGAVPPPGTTVRMPLGTPADDAAATAVPGRDKPPPAIGPATASIRFARSNRTAPLPPDLSVLEVAESIGVPIDYACRTGTCGTCRIRLLEGSVTMDVDEALTPEDKAANIILACQAKSIGNLVVET